MISKTMKKIAIALLLALSAALTMTSCDPDDVDAFASGYRDGYYGNY